MILCHNEDNTENLEPSDSQDVTETVPEIEDETNELSEIQDENVELSDNTDAENTTNEDPEIHSANVQQETVYVLIAVLVIIIIIVVSLTIFLILKRNNREEYNVTNKTVAENQSSYSTLGQDSKIEENTTAL